MSASRPTGTSKAGAGRSARPHSSATRWRSSRKPRSRPWPPPTSLWQTSAPSWSTRSPAWRSRASRLGSSTRLPFSARVERLPIFGLGCGGGVGGLARATRIAETMPGGHVLFLTVDLCSLCARGNDMSVANFVSIALFGDGAAAVVLRNTCGGGARRGRAAVASSALGEHCWADTASASWAGTSRRTASASC